MPNIHEEEAGLKRDVQEMPDDVLARLREHGVLDDYRERPAYQQNDYLWWIADAKQQPTRDKRIAQMLDELHVGGVYMGMKHGPSRKD